jgi:hypothetical protein
METRDVMDQNPQYTRAGLDHCGNSTLCASTIGIGGVVLNRNQVLTFAAPVEALDWMNFREGKPSHKDIAKLELVALYVGASVAVNNTKKLGEGPIVIMTDNESAQGAANKDRSTTMRDIFDRTENLRCKLGAIGSRCFHVGGAENVVADLLSRGGFKDQVTEDISCVRRFHE